MLPNTNTELGNRIDITTNLIMLVVTTDCEQKNTVHESIQTHVMASGKSIELYNMCYTEEQMPFPRVATDVLYYFAPKNQTPLFYRIGQHAMMDIADDIETAFKMMAGKSYLEAKFTPEMQKQIVKTDEYVKHEDLSEFPSAFQQARNLAKEMWKTGKNAAKGLPVLVSAEEGFQRMETCEGCDRFDKETSRCKECGCFMKTKTQLASATCPLNKWVSNS